MADKSLQLLYEPQEICHECGNYTVADNKRAQTTCSECGLVLSEREIDTNNGDRRAFNREDANNRLTRGDIIDYLLVDIKKTTHPSRREHRELPYNSHLKRALRINGHTSSTSEDRRDITIMRQLMHLVGILDLPTPILRKCAYFLRKFFKHSNCAGRSYAGLLTVTLYYICKREKYPIMLGDIKEVTGCRENLGNYFKLLQEIFPEFKLPLRTPSEFIPAICGTLHLSMEVQRSALWLTASAPHMSGKHPGIIAAAAVYLFAHGQVTQKQICDVVRCTEVSLRDRAKDLREFIGSLRKRPAELSYLGGEI